MSEQPIAAHTLADAFKDAMERSGDTGPVILHYAEDGVPVAIICTSTRVYISDPDPAGDGTTRLRVFLRSTEESS